MGENPQQTLLFPFCLPQQTMNLLKGYCYETDTRNNRKAFRGASQKAHYRIERRKKDAEQSIFVYDPQQHSVPREDKGKDRCGGDEGH